MTSIVTILTPGYADWETALLNAAARQYYRFETHFASPRGEPVTSAGGLRVQTDLAIEDIDPDRFDALVVNGGAVWSTPEAPDISGLANGFHARDKTVGAICDAVIGLARTGLLDSVKHTANGPESLPDTGYAGTAHYLDQPRAVLDHHIVTAPGTAPVSFMAAIMESLGFRNGDLDFYAGLYGAEHAPA